VKNKAAFYAEGQYEWRLDAAATAWNSAEVEKCQKEMK